MGSTQSRAIWVAMAPKFPALLSMFCSCVLMKEIRAELATVYRRRSPQRRTSCPPLLRAIFALSLSDIFFSMPFFITTWAAPAELDDPYLWGNVGNRQTCTTQGFILQLGIQSTPLFNFLQAFFVLLMTRYDWSVAQIENWEGWVHGAIWLYSLAASLFPVPLDLYNSNILVCYLGGSEKADLVALISCIFPLWIVIPACLVCMMLLYKSVHETEQRTRRYSSDFLQGSTDGSVETLENHPSIHRRNRLSRAVAEQAMWYMGAFFLAHTFNLVNNILFFSPLQIYNEIFDMFTYILAPLQGFFNALVYFRSRQNPITLPGKCLRRLVAPGNDRTTAPRQPLREPALVDRNNREVPSSSSKTPSSQPPAPVVLLESSINDATNDSQSI